MWHSGLRGAIAFALVSTLPEDIVEREMYISATLAVVVFTTVFVGFSAPPALRVLKIKTGDQTTPEEERAERAARLAANPKSIASRFHAFDKKYLLPMLSNKLEELDSDRLAQYRREVAHASPLTASGSDRNNSINGLSYYDVPHQDSNAELRTPNGSPSERDPLLSSRRN